jgi:hypothetical protein
MAIAALPEQQEFPILEMPWPRPALTLVGGSESVEEVDCFVEASIHELVPERSLGRVAVRRVSAGRYRVRRLAAVIVVLAALIALALPLQSLGAVTVSGVDTPGGSPAGLADGSLYIVQPGDTVNSIASAINPTGNHAKLVSEIVKTVGSHTVVPGEHILLP